MAEGSARLARMFDSLWGERACLIAYATGFYPDRTRSLEVVRAMLESGADAVEIGVPFSDPVMDGPVIQETSAAALEAGATPVGVIDMVAELRESTDRPLLIMTYYNPVLRLGPEQFVRRAAGSGVDGIVVPDLPTEEMGPWKRACDDAGVATVAFCSMTTSPERIREAAAMTSGFLYCISLLGTTGTRTTLAGGLEQLLERVRENATCPVAVGLGVSTPDQCARIGAMADGVIVGSALMKEVRAANGDLSGLERLVGSLRDALSSV